jgi:hypothetical protein
MLRERQAKPHHQSLSMAITAGQSCKHTIESDITKVIRRKSVDFSFKVSPMASAFVCSKTFRGTFSAIKIQSRVDGTTEAKVSRVTPREEKKSFNGARRKLLRLEWGEFSMLFRSITSKSPRLTRSFPHYPLNDDTAQCEKHHSSPR